MRLRHEIVGPAGAADRIRIAHLSDFHLWFSTRTLDAVEKGLATCKPDLLALTGDYADTPKGRALAVAWIEEMARDYPLCWVAGNHDVWWGRRFLGRLHALSHAHAIDRRDAWIAGSHGRYFRFTSLERMHEAGSLAPKPVPTVVLLHDPARIKQRRVRGDGHSLLLAGHLHGGQITLWRDRAGRSLPAAWWYPWTQDRCTIQSVPLIISRGLGDTLPIRFRTPREIVVIDFHTDRRGA